MYWEGGLVVVGKQEEEEPVWSPRPLPKVSSNDLDHDGLLHQNLFFPSSTLRLHEPYPVSHRGRPLVM